MRSHAGIASRMFRALSEEGINIQMISTSEIKISVVIDERYLELGVRTLHEEFNLGSGGLDKNGDDEAPGQADEGGCQGDESGNGSDVVKIA